MSNFAFFGLEVAPGKPQELTPDQDIVLHITNVALSPSATANQKATLRCTTGDQKVRGDVCLCVSL